MESCRQLIINLLWIFCNIAVLCPSIYGAEGVNATELLDRFDRGSGSKGTMGKDANREVLRFVLRLLTSRMEDEMKTSTCAPLNGHTSRIFLI